MHENPFRIGGSVGGAFFTNREREISRMVAALAEPQAKLLVYGPRRMGKTSALEQAVERVRRQGHHAIIADLSTATTVADLSTRVLRAATRDLGRRFTDVLGFLARRIGVGITAKVNPLTGEQSIGIDLGERSRDVAEQRRTFGEVLDAIDALAAAKRTAVGVVLDEFQEVHRLGGVQAEAHLRGVIQVQKHTSYVLAGSRESLIRQMLGKQRPFYKLLEPMAFGPMDATHLARWIERRMAAGGLTVRRDAAHSAPRSDTKSGARSVVTAVGDAIVALAGPRTRDVVQLARVAFDGARVSGQIGARDVPAAFRQIVADEDDQWTPLWDALPPLQQNVLRAIAAGVASLYAAESRRAFALGETGATAKGVAALERKDLVVRGGSRGAPVFAFDSPFFRGWVVWRALPDVGIVRDPALWPGVNDRSP